MASKVMHGARAQLQINGKSVGIFTQVSWSLVYDVNPVFILGRMSPAELVYTAQEAVQVSCSGWRVLYAGPHAPKGGSVPKLQELIRGEDITLAVFDRQTGKEIMSVVGCKSQGYSTSVSNRQLQEITVNFLGTRVSDETAQNAERAADAALPDEVKLP